MSEFDEEGWIAANPRPEGNWQEEPVKKWLRKKQHAKASSKKDGYDPLGNKIVSDEESAYIKANPEPFPDIRVMDMTPAQFKIHKAWMDAKRYALRTEEEKEAERARQRNERANLPPEKRATKADYQREYRTKNARELGAKAKARMARPGKVEHRRKYERERKESMSPEQLAAFDQNRRKNAKARRQRAVEDGSITDVRAREAMHASLRRAKVKRATPANVDMGKVAEIYLIAQVLKKLTGIKHDVDHVIPISGTHPGSKKRSVSGLNVPDNLRVIPNSKNVRKNSKFSPGDPPPRAGIRQARALLRRTTEELA